MKFKVTIDCGNAAFKPEPDFEVGAILRQLADKIENGFTSVYLVDSNGNKVGFAEFIK